MQTNVQKSYGVPIAIVIAGLLIAGAVVFSGGRATTSTITGNHAGGQPSGEFRMPSEDDHVRGNQDAPIAVVEFSDLECPFCARIHPTLSQIIEKNNDVKWIYRHFPLSSIHSRALFAAVASECIAKLGGNDAFWSFTDNAFAGGQLSDSWYREQAESFGIDLGSFASCMEDQNIVSDIQTDLDEATDTGGRGTPYVIVVSPNGNLFPFSGALSYAQISGVIEQARNN